MKVFRVSQPVDRDRRALPAHNLRPDKHFPVGAVSVDQIRNHFDFACPAILASKSSAGRDSPERRKATPQRPGSHHRMQYLRDDPDDGGIASHPHLSVLNVALKLHGARRQGRQRDRGCWLETENA